MGPVTDWQPCGIPVLRSLHAGIGPTPASQTLPGMSGLENRNGWEVIYTHKLMQPYYIRNRESDIYIFILIIQIIREYPR